GSDRGHRRLRGGARPRDVPGRRRRGRRPLHRLRRGPRGRAAGRPVPLRRRDRGRAAVRARGRRGRPSGGAGPMTGAEVLLAEIGEQPGVLERIRGDGSIVELAARLAAEPPTLVRLAAHGSSDNAATYGIYAFGRLAGRTALRDSISMPVYDGVRLGARGELAIALSQ